MAGWNQMITGEWTQSYTSRGLSAYYNWATNGKDPQGAVRYGESLDRFISVTGTTGATWVTSTAYRQLMNQSVIEVAPNSVRYGPHMEGPLPTDVAKTFRGGSYSRVTLESDTTLYRAYGGRAGELGSYLTRTPPQGPLQARMDLALKAEWGNTAQKMTMLKVPKGTVIYEGAAAPQGNLLGGGNQVYIPKVESSWVIKP